MPNGGGPLKVKIEIVTDMNEPEIVIRCNELTDEVANIQRELSKKISDGLSIIFYKNNDELKEEYYFSVNNVLFFETESDTVYAHTVGDVYKVDFKLYELQSALPSHFLRVSKSTIVNSAHVLSISRNLTSSSLVKFHKSHKQIYVSRLYYKELKQKLSERKW